MLCMHNFYDFYFIHLILNFNVFNLSSVAPFYFFVFSLFSFFFFLSSSLISYSILVAIFTSPFKFFKETKKNPYITIQICF